MLGRSSLTFAPIIGVLVLSFAGYGWLQTVTIQIPRKLDMELERPDPIAYPPKLVLHADGSCEVIEYEVGEEATQSSLHVEAPRLAETLRDMDSRGAMASSLAPDGQNVVQLQADDGVLWGDFVATVSSVRHITRGEVLVVSYEP